MSKLVSSVAIFNEIEKTRPDLGKILQQNFYFDSRAQNPNEDKFQKVPIFVKHDNLVSALHKRRYILDLWEKTNYNDSRNGIIKPTLLKKISWYFFIWYKYRRINI